MRWDNQSQRMGRFVFRIFVYDNPHTAVCDPFSVSCGYMRIILFLYCHRETVSLVTYTTYTTYTATYTTFLPHYQRVMP